MTDDRRKKRSAKPPQRSGAASENDRPTVNPPFDVAAFARIASGPSSQQRRSAAEEAPTKPPPPDAPPQGEAGEARARQVTRTDEAELEAARVESTIHSEPPGPGRASPLSIADARASSSPSMPPVMPERSITPTSIAAAVLGAIGASSPEITERTIDDPTAEMRERFSLGDYTGALEMSGLILAEEPSNFEAAECGENCRTVLEQMYAARLGPLERVPMVVVPRTQMRWLSMDHRAGFILSLIDGNSSVDLILDVGGMPRLDALRILHELVQQKIVAFR
jgi:hypothetical protein